jgi:predicted enzyme related to lactoylglutathione lyase
MPVREKYEHGTFCWVELATTDGEAAKRFYGELFGWKHDDRPMGPDMTYTMCNLGGKTAAALFEMGKDTAAGTPPSWASYIAVDDVDATVAKASARGGKAVQPPMDVTDAGRMAVIQDPTGAVFRVWKGNKHPGAGVVNEPGAVIWNELLTNDIDRAGQFYVDVIGWRAAPVDMGPMGTYTLFGRSTHEQGNAGGMMNLGPQMKGVPPHWLAYFAVTDCDASAKKVSQLGGEIVTPPMDVPDVGRFAIVQDPQGAKFVLFKPTT